MKKLFPIVATLAVALIFCVQAKTQTTGTNLVVRANYTRGVDVQGQVTLSRMNGTASETVIVSRPLSGGRAAFQTTLAPNALYDVILTTSNGTQLVKFPFTTALINPTNLQRATVSLVFSPTDNSLKSASVSVDMDF